jgi:3-methyladenine DNA glycosylase AlkD
MTVAGEWLAATVRALAPLANPHDAAAMRAYLKDVSPFLGVRAPARRQAQRAAWRALPPVDVSDVGPVAEALWAMPEHEYQYAACDLLARESMRLPGAFIIDPTERFLRDRPWWDTVDTLGNAVITPVVARHPEQVETMWRWWDSPDRWLIRAAIGHQRGLRERTDLDRLFAMCHRYASEREFFIAKAIGWALRDVTSWNPAAVDGFVRTHPDLSSVARREALRGLARARGSGRA